MDCCIVGDRELPATGQPRIDELKKIHDELLERIKPFTKRKPWLKIMRLLAAIYPKDISCVVDYGKLRQLTKAMFAKLQRGQSDMVTMNALVYRRSTRFLERLKTTPRALLNARCLHGSCTGLSRRKVRKKAGKLKESDRANRN